MAASSMEVDPSPHSAVSALTEIDDCSAGGLQNLLDLSHSRIIAKRPESSKGTGNVRRRH
jgi:hypothetical protein